MPVQSASGPSPGWNGVPWQATREGRLDRARLKPAAPGSKPPTPTTTGINISPGHKRDTDFSNHCCGCRFSAALKPYRGAGPAMNDLIAGHVQMFFDLMPVVLPQIAAGKVRALANAGAKRPSALADVPTVAEQGLVGFDASSWYGLVAPAKTPEPVLAKLRDEVAKALEAPDMVARIRELGSEPGAAFGKDFGVFLAAETKKWAEVIRTSGAKAD